MLARNGSVRFQRHSDPATGNPCSWSPNLVGFQAWGKRVNANAGPGFPGFSRKSIVWWWEMTPNRGPAAHSLRSWPCAGGTERSKVRMKREAGSRYGPGGPSGSPQTLWEIGGGRVGAVGRRKKKEEEEWPRSFKVRSDNGPIPTQRPKGGEQAVDARLESDRRSSESVHTVQSRAHVGRVVPGAEERHIWSSS